jgi:hypothetical protein
MPGMTIATAIMLVLSTQAGSAGHAKGTIRYQSGSGPVVVTIGYAFLVKGASVVDGKPVRRLILSADDIGASLRACDTMLCADLGLADGIMVDLDAGPRLEYWFVADGQRLQYSGTADPSSMTLATDTPQRLAGRWMLDARGAGGPLVDIEFDTLLFKELETERRAHAPRRTPGP